MEGALQGLPAGHVCEKWSQLRHLILSLSEQSANYVVVQHRNAEGKYQQIARCDLLPELLHSWHAPENAATANDDDEEDPDADDQDNDDGDDGDDGDDEGMGSIRQLFDGRSESRQRPAGPSMPRTWAEIRAAALRYIVSQVVNNLEPGNVNGFRLRAYSSKGETVLSSLIFEVRSTSTSVAIPPPPPTVPEELSLVSRHNAQPLSLLSLEPVNPKDPFSGIRALNAYYAQFGEVVINGTKSLIGTTNDMVSGLYGQLKQSNRHRDDLVAAILELQMHREQKREASAASAREGDQRIALAEKALVQMTEAFKVLYAAQGINPELAEVASMINGSPELMEALKHPSVRNLMKDPNSLRGLAAFLMEVARMGPANGGGAAMAESPSAGQATGQAPGTPGAQPASTPGNSAPPSP